MSCTSFVSKQLATEAVRETEWNKKSETPLDHIPKLELRELGESESLPPTKEEPPKWVRLCN